MAGRRRGKEGTRARLLSAAAHEFAARGFEGATVDRIAARARVNKAMVYYHFRHKAALYQEILRDVFGGVAAAVEAARADGATPECQLRAFIVVIAEIAVGWPDFPQIWLREMAEGGRHVDGAVMAEMGRVVDTLAAILADGHRDGVFRPAPPFVAHLNIVAPLLLFAASGPIRARFKARMPGGAAHVSREAMIQYVQQAAQASLAAEGTAGRMSMEGARR